MSTTIITHEGYDYQVGIPTQFIATHVMDIYGKVSPVGEAKEPIGIYMCRMPKFWTIGGLTFKETGEFRVPIEEEWVIWLGRIYNVNWVISTETKYAILEFVKKGGN